MKNAKGELIAEYTAFSFRDPERRRREECCTRRWRR